MPVDDEVLAGTPPDAAPVRGRNRGFWLVAGAIGFACVFVVIEIFANFGTKDTIAHAEHTLRTAQAAVEREADARGPSSIDAARMASVEPSIAWVSGTTASDGLDVVSLATASGAWGAAVQARPGACFYLHGTAEGELSYGVGTVCTGERALEATDPRW